jgi:hypothetical protein
LLYELSELRFSSSLIRLISWFLSNRKFRVMVEGELSTPRYKQAGAPTLYSLYINDAPQTPGVYLSPFADNTCIYTTDHKEGYVLDKLQRGLISMESWCERWNIRISEDETRVILFSHRRRPQTYRNDRHQGPKDIY